MKERTTRIHICDDSGFAVIGRTGENEFRTVELDVSGWAEGAEFRIIYSRPDGITYAVSAPQKGNTLYWTPTAYDLEIPGFGKFEIRAYYGDTVGKSAVFRTQVQDSIRTDETQPGTVRPDWVDDIIDKVVIESVEQVVTSTEDGGVNIIGITLTNGEATTVSVRNGSRGSKGDRGEKGDKGDNGKDGKDGSDGVNGVDGIDGYTPQRGIDYWTEEDKAELVESVDAYTKEEIDTFRFEDTMYVESHVSARLAEYVSKEEFEASLGDIEAALDELHSYATAIIGGAE